MVDWKTVEILTVAPGHCRDHHYPDSIYAEPGSVSNCFIVECRFSDLVASPTTSLHQWAVVIPQTVHAVYWFPRLWFPKTDGNAIPRGIFEMKNRSRMQVMLVRAVVGAIK